MTDIVDSKRRSELMANIRGRDTAPELAVRRIAHRMGLRFRLHRRDLPGRPDLVFPKHRLAVFVHGCFWHRHEGCRHASTPRSRVAFWVEKFAANVERDVRQEAALRALGWRVLVIWQCETRDEAAVERKLSGLVGCDRAASKRRSASSFTPCSPPVDYRPTARSTEISIHPHSPPDRVKNSPCAAGSAGLGFDERTWTSSW